MSNRQETRKMLTRNFPELSAHKIVQLERELHQLALDVHKNAENLCNLPDWEDQRESLRKAAELLLEKYGLSDKMKIGLSGDPRGFTTHLFVPNRDYNSWGGEESGWGISV